MITKRKLKIQNSAMGKHEGTDGLPNEGGRSSGSRRFRTLKARCMIHGNEKSSIDPIIADEFLTTGGETLGLKSLFENDPETRC